MGSREGSDDGAGSTRASADFLVEDEMEAKGVGFMNDRGIVVDAANGSVMMVARAWGAYL